MRLDKKLKSMYSSVKKQFSNTAETNARSMYKSQKGFTRLELLVVGGMMSLIGAIAIPNIINAVEANNVKRCAIDINHLYQNTNEYVEEDESPTFNEFSTWLEQNKKTSVYDFERAGVAFNEYDALNTNSENGEQYSPRFVVACRGHEHPNASMPLLNEGEEQDRSVKVLKLFRVEGTDFNVLEKEDDDWFTEKIEKNYR